MEDLILLAVQALIECLFNVLCVIPFDWTSRNRTTPESPSVFVPRLLWFCAGCALAGISLLIFNRTLIAIPALRVANLALAPIASAYLSEKIATRRAATNPFIIPRNHFWQAFLFTFGLVLIRFVYASRA